jgi:hypothetical protein
VNNALLVDGTESSYSVLMRWQVYFAGSMPFSWKLPCTCKLYSLWLLTHPGYITQSCSPILQWQIAWSLFPTPLLPWFSSCTPGKIVLYNSKYVPKDIQQPEIEEIQLLTVKLCYSVAVSDVCIPRVFSWGHSYRICPCKAMFTACSKVVPIGWDFNGCLLSITGYDAVEDHDRASWSIPWDPGGAAWWRLEGKPPFKEEGMLATLLSSPWVGSFVPHLLGLGYSEATEPRTTNTWQSKYRQLGLDSDGFGLLSLTSLSSSRVPLPL